MEAGSCPSCAKNGTRADDDDTSCTHNWTTPDWVPTKATVIRSDSEGGCKVSKNPVFRKRLKHLPLRHHYLRERCRAGDTELLWIKGTDNPADMLTKSLAKGPFEKHREMLMGNTTKE